MNFDFVEDEDFVASEGYDDGPEDGYRGRDDGDVDFEDAEDVDERDVKGHVDDGYGASAAYR